MPHRARGPTPRSTRTSFWSSCSLLLAEFFWQELLPGAVVDRALECGPRRNQTPAQGPLISVIEALAGIRLGRRVQKAGHLELLFIEQPTGFLDQVTGMPPGILVDRLGRAGFRPEHRGERRAVELVPRRFAARRMGLHQHAQAAFFRDADPGLHEARRRDLALRERVQPLLHRPGERPLDLLALEKALEQFQRREVRAV